MIEEDNNKIENKKDDSTTSHLKDTPLNNLKNLPPEVKTMIEMGFSFQKISSPIFNPLFEKFNEKHIDSLLELFKKEDEHYYKDAQITKRYSLIYFLLILAFLCFLILFLTNKDRNLLLTIFEKGIYILGGFGGGYGFKAYLDSKKRN